MSENLPFPHLNIAQAREKMNRLAGEKQAFLFVFDYKLERLIVLRSDEIDASLIRYKIGKYTNDIKDEKAKTSFPVFEKIHSPSLDDYASKFTFVQNEIKRGNSFLVNLTQATEVFGNFSLLDFYSNCFAKYKLWIKDSFTVLSPEIFIQIRGNEISSFPMKGTIDASIPDAEDRILKDKKEEAEHATIVDLIRNDLSMVASNVKVTRYRYVDRIKTSSRDLLQVSSEISGRLSDDYRHRIGDVVLTLLPAGSISGAPKRKTLEIIEQAETYERGFYTGVCGFFDGENLDTAVMIRFIEQQGERFFFKSGGGITAQSSMMDEYRELIQKVYVPIS